MTRPQLLRRIGIGLVAVVAVIAVVLATVAVSWVRRPYPQTGGELVMSGLTSEVTVIRDERGIPNIYADNVLDLMRAQGFVHAQDRFFEMDLRRHVASGRLAELVGEPGVEADKVIRTMGWREVAAAELPILEPRTRQYLQAYADGVNAYIGSHSSPSRMALEYVVLAQETPGYQVEEWTPVDSLVWLKAMAWDLRGNYTNELMRARLADRMGMAQIDEIFPPYPFQSHQPILGPDEWAPATSTEPAQTASIVPPALTTRPVAVLSDADAAALSSAGATRAYAGAMAAMAAVPSMLGRGSGLGSNSWVVSGARSTTGKPLLANDPHLGVGIPGIWYQVGLHCRTASASCPLNVSGFSFAGVPGVIIGHNASIAWGFTNLGPDVTDFYLERVTGDTYLRDGKDEKITSREETIKVAGGDDVTITIRSTHHGPLVSDVIPTILAAGSSAPVQGRATPQMYAVSLAWTALTPGQTADAVVALNTATNFDQFRAAAAKFEVPAQNLVYADTAGHIGYQAPGRVPIRTAAIKNTAPGYWPAPGWDSTFDWRDSAPFAQLPWTLDPPDGVIVTANQAVTALSRPFFTNEWDYGYRSQRITDLIGADGTLSPDRMREIQLDDQHAFAPILVKALLDVDLNEDAFTKQGQDLLRDWDFTTPAGPGTASSAAAYYNAVWTNLMRLLFDDELPEDLWADGGDQWMEAVKLLLDRPRSLWWDDKQTPGVTEGSVEILRKAMVSARLDLTRHLGKDPDQWDWGKIHTVTLTHKVLGGEGVPGLVRWLFNRGPHGLPGGSSIVNANAFDASQGFEVTAGPSMRMVVDLAALDTSTWVNQTGNSGHAFNDNYDDQIEAWATGEQFPWPFTEDAVRAAADEVLTLRPRTSR